MKHEWPIAAQAPAQPPPQAPLPRALDEHAAQVLAGDAVRAIARKRAVQAVTHGHTAEADLAKSPALLAHEARARLNAFLEIMPMGRMNLPPHNRERCLRCVEIAAAILIALWDRCQAEVPDQ